MSKKPHPRKNLPLEFRTKCPECGPYCKGHEITGYKVWEAKCPVCGFKPFIESIPEIEGKVNELHLKRLNEEFKRHVHECRERRKWYNKVWCTVYEAVTTGSPRTWWGHVLFVVGGYLLFSAVCAIVLGFISLFLFGGRDVYYDPYEDGAWVWALVDLTPLASAKPSL